MRFLLLTLLEAVVAIVVGCGGFWLLMRVQHPRDRADVAARHFALRFGPVALIYMIAVSYAYKK